MGTNNPNSFINDKQLWVLVSLTVSHGLGNATTIVGALDLSFLAVQVKWVLGELQVFSDNIISKSNFRLRMQKC